MLFYRISKDHLTVIFKFLDRGDLNNLLLTSKDINRNLKSQYLQLVKQNNSLYLHHLLHYKDQVKSLIACWDSIHIPKNILLNKLFQKAFTNLPYFSYKQNKFDLRIMALIASQYQVEFAREVNLETLLKFKKSDVFDKLKMLSEKPMLLRFLYFYSKFVLAKIINFISGYSRLGMTHRDFENSNILFIAKVLANCLNLISLVSLKYILDKPHSMSRNIAINSKLVLFTSGINIILDAWKDLSNPRSLILTKVLSLAKINPYFSQNNDYSLPLLEKDVSYLFNKLKRA